MIQQLASEEPNHGEEGSSTLDINIFTAAFDPILDEEMSRRCGQVESPEDYFFLSYEAALERAGVDYERDGEQLLTEYIFPALEEIKEDYIAKDEAALNIYRKAGLDEIKVRWRNFDTAKLSLLQKRKIHKIAKDLELLGDAQMHFIIMGTVIYRKRPDLKEKYGKLKALLPGDR